MKKLMLTKKNDQEIIYRGKGWYKWNSNMCQWQYIDSNDIEELIAIQERNLCKYFTDDMVKRIK